MILRTISGLEIGKHSRASVALHSQEPPSLPCFHPLALLSVYHQAVSLPDLQVCSLVSLVRLVRLISRLGGRRAVIVSSRLVRAAVLVGRLILCGLGSSRVLGRLVIRRCRLSRRGVLLVRDMGLGIRVVMFVLVTVLLDVPRWVIESGIVGAEGGGEWSWKWLFE